MVLIKRVFSLTAASVLMSAACLSVSAAGKPTFSVTDASGSPGEEVTVRCEIKDNPGIVGFHLLVDYDPDAFTLTGAEGGIFTGTSFGSTDRTPFSFLWTEGTTGNYTDNGTLAVLTFKIKDGAANGSYPVTLSYDEEEVFDYDLVNVHFETEAGKITVTGGKDESRAASADSSGKPSDSKPESKPESRADSSKASPDSSSSSAGNEKTGGGESSVSESSASRADPDGSNVNSTDVSSAAESSKEKLSEADSLSGDSAPGAVTSEDSTCEAAADTSADSSSEGTESAADAASSEAGEEKSSAAPIAIIVLIAAAVGGAVSIIIIKGKKQ